MMVDLKLNSKLVLNVLVEMMVDLKLKSKLVLNVVG